MKRFVTIAVLAVLSALFFGLSVYPQFVFNLLSTPPEDQSSIDRFIGLTFTVLLTLLGFAVGAAGIFSKRSSISGGNFSMPSSTSRHAGHADPCKRVVILDRDIGGSAVVNNLRTACILGNVKPVVTTSLAEAERLLALNGVLGVMCAKGYQEEFRRVLNRARGSLFVVGASRDNNVHIGSTAQVTTLGLPAQPGDVGLYSIAKEVAKLHALDTPRGVGFSGNWMGTYGLITFSQDQNGRVKGCYWYAVGEIEGECEVDLEEDRLILIYKWTQRKNDSDVGSKDFGEGMFVIPAGHEFFYGYWHDTSTPEASQTWCGSRISRDVTDQIVAPKPGNGPDLGLTTHTVTRMYSWDQITQVAP